RLLEVEPGDPRLDSERIRPRERERPRAAVRLPADDPAEDLGIPVEAERKAEPGVVDLRPTVFEVGEVDVVVASLLGARHVPQVDGATAVQPRVGPARALIGL